MMSKEMGGGKQQLLNEILRGQAKGETPKCTQSTQQFLVGFFFFFLIGRGGKPGGS